MFTKKTITPVILLTLLFVVIFQTGCSNKKDSDDLTKKIVIDKNLIPKNLEKQSIQQLTKVRDHLIDNNLKPFGDEYGKATIKQQKNKILNSNVGIAMFIDKKYSNLKDNERLIKQINFIEYLNEQNKVIDVSGSLFNVEYKNYEFSDYLKKHGQNSNIDSYSGVKYLIDNLSDVCKSVDYSPQEIIHSIDPYSIENISEKQKKELNDKLKKSLKDNKVSPKTKKAIKGVFKNNI